MAGGMAGGMVEVVTFAGMVMPVYTQEIVCKKCDTGNVGLLTKHFQ